MQVCPHCGRSVEDQETVCPECRHDMDPSAGPKTRRLKAQPTRTFDFSSAAPAKPASPPPEPVVAEPEPEPEPAPEPSSRPVETIPQPPLKERELVGVFRRLGKDRRFWLALAGGLAALVLVSVVIQVATRLPWSKKPEMNVTEVRDAVRAELEPQLTQLLAEKLEWGRAAMRRRLPSRFPEELQMAYDLAKAEIRFEDPKRTQVQVHLVVAYHYLNAREDQLEWMPVVFYFEKRDGQWSLVGDPWMTEWDLHFE